MSIDFKDVITFKLKDGGRIAIPRTAILSLKSKTERDYSGGTAKDVEVTCLFVEIATAELLGVNTKDVGRYDKGVFVVVQDKFEIALSIMQGKAAAEILF